MFSTGNQILPRPGIAWGNYPQRPFDNTPGPWAQAIRASAVSIAELLNGSGEFIDKRRALAQVRDVERRSESLRKLDDSALDRARDEARAALSCGRLNRASISCALAVICAVCERTLGMKPFRHQLLAAAMMLENRFVEMRTGEGKTLAAGIASATAAMAGIPVHLMTANDYLVERDEALIRPLFRALGLSSSTVLANSEANARRQAYQADVVYSTAREIAFDYLRDRLVVDRDHPDLQMRLNQLQGADPVSQPLLRGLCMAVLDEADSILLDDAGTPLILSQAVPDGDGPDEIGIAWTLAAALWRNRDFRVHAAGRSVELTDAGAARLEHLAEAHTQAGLDPRVRDELVGLALSARHRYLRDRDYLLCDGKVLMIDESTGRIADGRSWSRGLQQLIEIKEGVERTARHAPIAQITYQRFFPRYLRLTGMSGTLAEARRELRLTYRCPVRTIAPGKPSARRDAMARCYRSSHNRWRAVVAVAARAAKRHQPTLIGTDSVAASAHCSALLSAAGISHRLLSAAQDADEADVIGRAGTEGSITVATNMAGRGTDIHLCAGALRAGGLLVIACSPNRERRICRQLKGRAGRQGDPGTTIGLYALDDPLFAERIPTSIRRLLSPENSARPYLPGWLSAAILALAYRLEEGAQRRQRARLLDGDSIREQSLSMGGRGE